MPELRCLRSYVTGRHSRGQGGRCRHCGQAVPPEPETGYTVYQAIMNDLDDFIAFIDPEYRIVNVAPELLESGRQDT